MKLDDLLPAYDVAARYQTLVNASPLQTGEALRHTDFSASPVVRLLMALRTLGWARGQSAENQSAEERLRAAGFVELHSSDTEWVIGVVGRFWRFDSGILKPLTADEVLRFEREGFAKALWNFTVEEAPGGCTRLATETRVLVFGSAARRRFRGYWLLVGPFSGLIRKEMLRLVKRRAEAAARERC